MRRQLFGFASAGLVMWASVTVQAGLVINEALVSTTGADTEFIEIFNSGTTTIDISGFQIVEIESDTGAAAGTIDDTFEIPDTEPINLAPGEFFLIGNEVFETAFNIVPDLSLALSVENSSTTLILQDALGADLFSVFLDDGDGVAQVATPDISVGPDGTFLPAGFFLTTDGGSTAGILEFAPVPAASATPGASNVPEPASLALLGLGGLVMLGRGRRQA